MARTGRILVLRDCCDAQLCLCLCLIIHLTCCKAHISDILKSKFINFRNFHTMLYTCAPEFDFMEVEVSFICAISVFALHLLLGINFKRCFMLSDDLLLARAVCLFF